RRHAFPTPWQRSTRAWRDLLWSNATTSDSRGGRLINALLARSCRPGRLWRSASGPVLPPAPPAIMLRRTIYSPNRKHAFITGGKDVVAPADRAGVVVRFEAKNDNDTAIVILVDKDKKPLAVGSPVRLENSQDEAVVGYDGQTYLKGLGASNVALVTTDHGECRASFPFTPRQGQPGRHRTGGVPIKPGATPRSLDHEARS